MPTLYQNTMLDELADDLELARKLGVKPKIIRDVTDLDADFAQICNSGVLKWVINKQSELVIAPKWFKKHEIPHSVLVNGEPVLAAGEVEISFVGSECYAFDLTNHSGHYLPSDKSKGICRNSLKKLGIKVS